MVLHTKKKVKNYCGHTIDYSLFVRGTTYCLRWLICCVVRAFRSERFLVLRRIDSMACSAEQSDEWDGMIHNDPGMWLAG